MIVMWLWALLYYPALLMIKRTYDKSFYIIFNRDYMLVTGYKGTAFVSEKIEYSKIGYIMTGDNCPHRTIFGKTPEKLRRDYGAFTDVFDRKKEHLFSYAMNDDIIHFLRREMLDFTAFPVFFVSNLLLVQRKKYYFNRATVSRNCSIVL